MSWLSNERTAELLDLAEPDFVAEWAALFGEPPAAMIERSEMIELMRSAFEPASALALQIETQAIAARLSGRGRHSEQP